MKFCSKCGAQNVDGAAFCAGCGSAFGASTAQPSGGYQPANFRRAVQTDRSLIMYILLTLVTCGIYAYFFIYKLAEDTNEICFEDGESTPGLGMYILLSIVTCGFYSYYWLYKVQNRFCAAGVRYGISIVENGTTVLMWYIFGSLLCGIGAFVGMNIIITSANRLGNAYNQKYVFNR